MTADLVTGVVGAFGSPVVRRLLERGARCRHRRFVGRVRVTASLGLTGRGHKRVMSATSSTFGSTMYLEFAGSTVSSSDGEAE
jgi:hypothetical protein